MKAISPILISLTVLVLGSNIDIPGQKTDTSVQDSLMAVFVKSVLEEQIDRYLVIDSMANYTLIHQTHDSYTEVFIPGAQLFAADSTIISSRNTAAKTTIMSLDLLKKLKLIPEQADTFDLGNFIAHSRGDGRFIIVENSYILQHGSMTSWGVKITSYFERMENE